MTHCSSENLSLYFDDELPDSEKFKLEQHLSSCLSCRRELAQHRQLREALVDSSLDASGSSSLNTVVAPRRSLLWPKRLALVATLLLAFFTLDAPFPETAQPKTRVYKVRVADTKYTITTKGEAELLSIEIGDFQSSFELDM